MALPLSYVPVRPRGYAVDGKWPCTPIAGRWQYQRTATPTGFPATLTRRRWRLTLPDAHRAIPPPARVPPIGSFGDDKCIRAADAAMAPGRAHEHRRPAPSGPEVGSQERRPAPPLCAPSGVTHRADTRGLG